MSRRRDQGARAWARRTIATALLTMSIASGAIASTPFVSIAAAMPPGADGAAVRQAEAHITELRIEEAAALIGAVRGRHPADADVLSVDAIVRFHRGDYAGATAAMTRALEIDGSGREATHRRMLEGIMRATRDATGAFVDARSSDGRFIVRHAPGPDALLVPYAFEALTEADRVLSADLGFRMPGPVRLEIYPTPASLAAVSTLTVEEIERTGTIALCKWDRLMITSPRALLRGYPWMDTIAHEYVHLVLTRASRDRAPVWFQEGVAKFLERRWRSEEPAAHLEPAARALLTEAMRDGELLPFERLHPSIARLPSQEHAALAFAQVATFIESFWATHGGDGLRRAIEAIAEGADAREALTRVSGDPWSALEASWRARLARLPAAEDPPRLLPLRFRHGGTAVDEVSEVEEDAQRYFRLGNLLYGRGRPGAAAVEYGRALDAAPDDPIVASRMARASLEAGRPEPAIAALERIRPRYPDHAPLHAVLAAAYVARGSLAEGREAAREALRLNPFDPEPHCSLSLATEAEAERAQESRACRALGGTAQ